MPNHRPLAETLRPKSLDDFFGQSHLLNTQHPFRQAIDSQRLHSMILWGPSGTGKTTLARIIASQVKGHFEQLSAVLDGVKELRAVVENAKKFQQIGKQTLLFVDEIHRFNKAQQDGFLPHIESGLLVLIGATTENPFFEINKALLSRLSVYTLSVLNAQELEQILQRTFKHELLTLPDEALRMQIISASNGDARRLINIVEQISLSGLTSLNAESLNQLLQDKISIFDKGDIFYQQLSAFHKSVRGLFPDGALYWMARMLVAGCDAKTIGRRLLAIASEDIGNADPRALEITLNAWDIFARVGALKKAIELFAQAVVYCAVAPKSNAVYKAFNQAMAEAKETPDLSVPKHLCNAPTQLMDELGYGKEYRYAHDEPDAFARGQTYFPSEIGRTNLLSA
ncbi:MAG: recombination factor protein RarA [Candidatus Ruthia sp. Asou_11_S2]|nr:recombination factor protein RarA [Candidatus Ruthia sp. Asou_11_S2]